MGDVSMNPEILRRELQSTVKRLDELVALSTHQELRYIENQVSSQRVLLSKLRQEQKRIELVIKSQIEWCKSQGILLSWVEDTDANVS